MNIYQFSFEKLEVWQLARQLAKDVYKNSATFPSEEKFSLTSQLRRSVLAIGANIAEGTTRITAKDQAHFTTIAYSSLMEVFNHLIIAHDLGYVTNDEIVSYRKKIQLLSIKLSNLKTSQLKRIGKLGFFFWSFFIPTLSQALIPPSILLNDHSTTINHYSTHSTAA